MITQVELSHSASLPNEFSYLITLLITVPTCDLIMKSLVREIQIDLNPAVSLLNSSLCICVSFRAEVGTIFALSWLITWFGHVLSESKHTLRLYDFFLSSHPLMPIYLAATVRSRRIQREVKREIVTRTLWPEPARLLLRLCCTERRKWSRPSVTWQWSTTSSLAFPRISRMNSSYARLETCLTSTLQLYWPSKLRFSPTRGNELRFYGPCGWLPL